MRDPFPIACPAFLSSITSKYIATPLNLSTLPLHIHEILLSALVYQLICAYLSPFLSSWLFRKTYAKLNWRTKLNWDVHVVSLFQSLFINVLALWILFGDQERGPMDYRGRIWGYTGALGLVEAVAVGYFLWDFVICYVYINVFGWGLLTHAVSALAVYAFGFRPFVNSYAPVFILYELSSPFLNIHWFCDKLDLTGSDLQLYNGIILITSFFSSRLVWGVLNSYRVFSDIWRATQYQRTSQGRAWLARTGAAVIAHAAADSDFGPTGKDAMLAPRADAAEQIFGTAVPWPVPLWLGILYTGANVTLTLLNVYWFGKMIETVRARFEPPFGTKTTMPKRKDRKPAPGEKEAEALTGSTTSATASGADLQTPAKRKPGRPRKDRNPEEDTPQPKPSHGKPGRSRKNGRDYADSDGDVSRTAAAAKLDSRVSEVGSVAVDAREIKVRGGRSRRDEE